MALQVHACFRMRFMCLRVCVALRPMLSNANIVVAFVFEDKGKHQSWGWSNIEHREKSGSTQRIWVGVGREVHGYQKYFVCCKWMLYDNFLFSQTRYITKECFIRIVGMSWICSHCSILVSNPASHCRGLLCFSLCPMSCRYILWIHRWSLSWGYVFSFSIIWFEIGGLREASTHVFNTGTVVCTPCGTGTYYGSTGIYLLLSFIYTGLCCHLHLLLLLLFLCIGLYCHLLLHICGEM